jgi:hypothetical protein
MRLPHDTTNDALAGNPAGTLTGPPGPPAWVPLRRARRCWQTGRAPAGTQGVGLGLVAPGLAADRCGAAPAVLTVRAVSARAEAHARGCCSESGYWSHCDVSVG